MFGRLVASLTHTSLTQSHNSQNLPLLLRREHVSRLFNGICLIELESAAGSCFGTPRRNHFDVVVWLFLAAGRAA